MSEVRRTPVQVGGRAGVIVHDSLCADGPKDPKTGQPLIDPKTNEPYLGPNDDMADLIHIYQEVVRGNIQVSSGFIAPRFGVLSLLAMSTPIFVYDHPRFKQIANTAFTDGINVFIDADFMRKLVSQEEKSPGESGVIFLILHELMHKLCLHTTRLRGYPADIANIAEDMVINGKIIKGFNLKPVKLLSEIAHGLKPGEADKYHTMAEEVVAEQLLVQERQKKQKQKQQQKGQSGGSGSSQGGGGGGDQEEDQDNDQSQQNQSGGGKGNKQDKGQKGNQSGKGSGDQEEQEKNDKGGGKGNEKGDEEYSPIHHITPEELLEIMEEEGLGSVAEKLNMPKSGDVEGLGRKKEQTRMSIVDAVETAIAQANKAGGHYPGQHIAESAAEMVGNLERGKLVWKLGIKNHILGGGLKLHHSDEEAAMPWYLTEKDMGVQPWYQGSLVPQAPDETVLCLVDSSGSTSGGDMRKQFMQEVLTLKKGVSSAGDTAREVVLLSADTVLRGEPIFITEHNVEQFLNNGVPIFGNGGTDFDRCLKEALELPIMKKKKVKSVIYFTDCGDMAPKRSDFEKYLEKGIRIVFVTTPSMWNEQWNREVNWAEVYCIEEGTQIDLDKGVNEVNTNTRRNRM